MNTRPRTGTDDPWQSEAPLSREVSGGDQLADLVADLDALAGLWRKAATATSDLGPHPAGYDAALLLCARQLRQALAQVQADA